ncbi:MAG: glycosyltransferase [Candidatus Moraniibacteriota bacterium]
MNRPLVSVVMANYNNARFLPEAIESVLAQTYRNFEFFIVDDGSGDNSNEIIKKYQSKDSRIRHIRNEKNLGQSQTRNKAIEQANGAFIAIVDSDDICLPSRFEKQVNYMEANRDFGVIGTAYIIINKNGEQCSKKLVDDPDVMIRNGRVLVHNPTCMVRRYVFEKYGNFNSSFDYAEDAELYFRWYGQGVRFANIDQYLYKYRIHGGNVSTKKMMKQLWLLLSINLRAIFYFRIKFSLEGYRYVFEQFFYFIYLSLGLDKIYRRGK